MRNKQKPKISLQSPKIDEAFEYWRANPVEAVKDWFDITPDDYQGDILNALVAGDRVAMKSGHGVGKTTTLAWAGWWFLVLHDDSRLVATAPTQSQLHDVLWPEYSKWHNRMPEELAEQWDISATHIRNKSKPKLWFGIARTSNKPANLQGFHNANIMIQADESSAVPQAVFEVVEGTLSEAGENGRIAKLIMGGNPNFTTGELFNAFHKNAEMYQRFTVSGEPSFLDQLSLKQGETHKDHGRVYYSKRVTKKYRDTIAKKYGRDSAVYDVRVKGDFPRNSDISVIALQWAESAQFVPLPGFDNVADAVTLVMDVARLGGDETVLGHFRRGHCFKMQAWPKTTTVQCEDYVIEARKYYTLAKVALGAVIVDEPGVGGGVIDGLRRRNVPVIPYNGGASLKTEQDPEDDIRMFANRRSRDWWHLRRLMEQGLIHIPEDETLTAQLASVQYDYGDGNQKIQVESKKAMRERLGEDASPDRADVIVMGAAPWYATGSTNTDVREEDIIEGDDRPILEEAFR